MQFADLLKIFILMLLFGFPVKNQAQSQPYHDKEIAGYMAASEYRRAVKVAETRLKRLPANELEKRFYYLNQIGLAQFRMGNFDSAYVCGMQLLRYSGRTTDSSQIADGWKLMAYVYNRKGRFDSALYYSNKLLNYANRNSDYVRKGNALTSISTILMQNKRYREALKYNSEAYALNLKYSDSATLTVSEYNIGLSYLNLKKPDSSLVYLFKSLITNNKKQQLTAPTRH